MQNFYLVRILQRHELSKCRLTKCTFSLIYNHVQTPITLLQTHLEVKDFWQKQRFKLFQRFDDQNSRMLVFGSYKRIVIDVWIQKANFEKATLRSFLGQRFWFVSEKTNQSAIYQIVYEKLLIQFASQNIYFNHQVKTSHSIR